MLKRTLIVLSVTLVMVVALAPLRSVHGILITNAELLMLDSTDVSTASNAQVHEGSGKGFLRVLKAPFKAIGRLFGRGKKDDNKLHRLSEKDVKKFESTQVTRIEDATSVPIASTPNTDLSAPGHLEQGRALLNEGNLNEAIAELSLAASMDPKLAEAHNLIGVAYERKGLSELARQSFETAIKLDKKNPEILNNLGYLFYSNGDYRGALDRLKKAAGLDPDNARILNNLALAQSQLGNFDDAYKNFVRADGEVKGRLNMANRLELAGRREEALKHYEAARAQAAAEEKSNTSARSITVVMEIKNGFVTYASISNPRPGLGAYEASALRMARQRRYPTNQNGQESIVLRVSPLPAS
jgi:Flp pilus assembly protein TadD